MLLLVMLCLAHKIPDRLKSVTQRHYLETSHLEYLKPEIQRVADWIARPAVEVPRPIADADAEDAGLACIAKLAHPLPATVE